MRRSPRFVAGFTLLELSVVLFIMAILLGIALPRFSNFFESDLQKETRRIAAVLSQLRLEAILKGESYRLVFDSKENTLQVFTIDAADSTLNHPHENFKNPIKLNPPVEIQSITTGAETESVSAKFEFEKLKFEKIFGNQYQFSIDPSGFIDLFSVTLKDRSHSLTLQVKTIMGEMEIGHEIPL